MAIIKETIPGQNETTNKEKIEFSKVAVGAKTLTDATLKLGELHRIDPRLGDKKEVLKAIHRHDFPRMREISNFFFEISGIYSRLIRYMANLYRYDWMIVPYINSENATDKKILTDFNKALNYLDNSNIKTFFSKTALKVLKNGCYYGYVNDLNDKAQVQELPIRYCRSRFNGPDGRPAVEFDLQFFDDYFSDAGQRMRMLQMFPPEFAEGYVLYKQGKLKPDFPGDKKSWYLLDPAKSFKFNINGSDFPMFIATIPAILDLDGAQELDRKKMAQQLLKIIIQQMPIDKNGDLVFDIDEAQALHNNVVTMLNNAIGVDVLTTFADVKVEDLMNDDDSTSKDQLEKVERAVFNEAGIAQDLFNADGGLAMDKAVLNDEALMISLIRDFETFLNVLVDKFNKSNKVTYRVNLLNTTIYNYKDLSQTYKDQTQIGFSKVLPQIALGHSQSAILATVHFENDILDLVNKFIPPMSSNTMSNDAVKTLTGKSGSSNTNNKNSSNTGGRPTNESQGKSVSEKTAQNRESES